ncbi:UDP-N-acetylenolpyruvoylglucosamine reductase [Bacteroidia bacterium]|nr:UDP-N-acetylenolpyruvoylglucosamine reductase [Bacteroidia bacterium]GHV45196.1 UDP-N-acetylenolpyruvoylglucosamine reductase [Bacteroidia bacterium]
MLIFENVSLRDFNSFGIEANAKEFWFLKRKSELFNFAKLSTDTEKYLILGGGNNILFTKDFDGFVIKNVIRGRKIVFEDDQKLILRIGAGENWDEIVKYCTGKNLWGIENLAYIPADTGGALVQNIGAYGAEIQDVVLSVDVFDLKYKVARIYSKEQCQFAYRDSVFKKNENLLITAVDISLSKIPKVNRSYKDIDEYLTKNGIENPTSSQIAEIVTNIRKSKLPEVKELGSLGSFFKNPVVSEEILQELLKRFPNIPYYTAMDAHNSNSIHKISAAWLIENCGWKGYREGDAGVYEKHSLILVNYGNASGKEIVDLMTKIQHSVAKKFNIFLETEAVLI